MENCQPCLFLLADNYIHTGTAVEVVQVQVEIFEICTSSTKKTFFLHMKSFHKYGSERIKYQREQL